MEIYIKNNKAPVPVTSNVSRIISHTGVRVGTLYYRPTTTKRRCNYGTNRWNLFKFVPSSDEYIGILSDSEGITLGRYDGSDIRLDVHRVISKRKETPMGFMTPLVSESVSSVTIAPEFPSLNECGTCLNITPFHQKHGDYAYLEVNDIRDFAINAQLSYLAVCRPRLYDPKRPKAEMLAELAQIEGREATELGTFLPKRHFPGQELDQVYCIQFASKGDHINAGKIFCERLGLHYHEGLTIRDSVTLGGVNYEAEIYCSEYEDVHSNLFLAAWDAETAKPLGKVLHEIQLPIDCFWSLNSHAALNHVGVTTQHGHYKAVNRSDVDAPKPIPRIAG